MYSDWLHHLGPSSLVSKQENLTKKVQWGPFQDPMTVAHPKWGTVGWVNKTLAFGWSLISPLLENKTKGTTFPLARALLGGEVERISFWLGCYAPELCPLINNSLILNLAGQENMTLPFIFWIFFCFIYLAGSKYFWNLKYFWTDNLYTYSRMEGSKWF